MAVVEQIRGSGAATSEAAARHTLRDQIARLERELSAVVVGTYPRLDPGPALPSLGGPRLLSLGELERVRDALAARVTTVGAAADEQAARQAVAQRELEQMLADPPAHRWKRLPPPTSAGQAARPTTCARVPV